MRKKEKRPIQVHEDSRSLNKYISDTGFCSRREADDYIAQGRVTINDKPAALGNRVYEGDVVEVDGEPISKKVKPIYIAFNKPEGVTSTTDQADRTNIIDYIRHPQRIFPIGRLDKESEGLIFLTNDGNIVNKILRAGNFHEKEYLVTVDKPISTDFIMNMSEGVRIMRTKTRPCKVNQENKYMFRITLTQGMNRQIRRMCNELDYKVVKLVRVRIMNVKLGNLESGKWRYLTQEEIAMIHKLVSASSKTEDASFQKPKAKTSIQKKQPDSQEVNVPSSEEEVKRANLQLGLAKEKKKKGYREFRESGKKKGS